MKKLLVLISFLSIYLISLGQYNPVPGKWEYYFVKIDSALKIPSDTLASAAIGSIATKGSTLYVKVVGPVWVAITGAGGSGVWGSIVGDPATQHDLISLLNAKYDTTVRKLDTLYALNDSTLSTYINGRLTAVNIKGAVKSLNGRGGAITLIMSDIVSALGYTPSNLPNVTNLLQVVNAGGAISIQTGIFAAMPIAGFYGRFYVASDSLKIYFDNGITWNQISGSGGGGGSGTVTAIVKGYGLLPGTITTSGNVVVDSATLAMYFIRRIDSNTAFITPLQLSGKQDKFSSGNGFIKISGTTISYDNSVYQLQIIPSNTIKQYWNGFKEFSNLNTDSIGEGATNKFFHSSDTLNLSLRSDTLANQLYDSAAALRAAISGAANPGNPTTGISFSTVNGVASTYIRSDAAQKIDTNSVDLRYNINTTISAIRTMSSALSGVKYHITGNGQDGDFVYDPSDHSSLDNTGTILVDAAGHRLKRAITGSIVYGDWFGLPKDGITFDSTSVQLAVDWSGANGYTLQFSNGTLVMRNMHFNYSNFRLTGSGQTIIKAPITDTTANAAIINCDGVNNITIDHINFDGSLMKGSQAGGNPILRFHTDSNVSVTNFKIHKNAYTGVSFQQNCYNINIGDFTIDSTDVCIHFIGNENGSSNINIHNGFMFGGTSECITFQGIGGIPPSASHDITLSNLHMSYKANSSGLYLLYCYNVQGNNIEIDHCKAGIGGIPTSDRPDRTHDVTLTNINIHDIQNDGMGNLGKNFIGSELTFKNIGREAMAVGNTDNDAFVDSNVHIAHVTADSINTGHSANWGILRLKNCFNCTFDDIKGRFYSPNDTTTGIFAINFIGNSDSLVTVSHCVFPDGQVLSRSNKTDNYITFRDNFFKAINFGWAVTDSNTKQAVFVGNKYTGNPAKAITISGTGFGSGLNGNNPQDTYLMGSNLHLRVLEGVNIGRHVRLVSTANGNTIIHTKPGVAGNIHLSFYQDALLDSGRYVDLVWDGNYYNQVAGNAIINYWSVGSDTVTTNDTSFVKPKMDIFSGKGILIGGDAQLDNIRSTNTNKEFRIWMPAYGDPKRFVGVMYGNNNGTLNTLTIGGVSPNFDAGMQIIDFSVAPYTGLGVNQLVRISYPDQSVHFGSSGFTGTINLSLRKNINDAAGNGYMLWTRGIHASPLGSTESYNSLWVNDSINNAGNGLSVGIHVNPNIVNANGGYAGTFYDYNSGWNFYSPSTSVSGWSAGGIRLGAGNSAGHASAQLDGNGTGKTKGWLPNVLTGAQMNAIVTPDPGLFVICSDSGYAICYYDNSAWRKSGYGLTGGGSDSGFAALSSSLVNVPIQKSVIGAKRYVLWDTAANNPGAITTRARLQATIDSLNGVIARKQDTSSKFNLYFRGKGQPGDTSSVYGHDSSIYVRAKRDSLDYHHTVLPDSSEVDFVQAHDTTSGNGLQSIYRSDTARANIYAAIATRHIYSKNAAIAVSGDSVQAQNLAFVDSTSNGVLGVLYDSLTWNSPLGYLQQSGSGVTVSSNQIQLVEADNNGTVYVRLPTNTCLDQQNLSANFVIKATNSGDSGAMISLVSVNTHSISSLFARLNTTTRKVELLTNQNGSTTIITSAATLPTSIATGDSITLQLINNNQVITAQATDRTTANTISVSFSNTFAFGAPLFIANTGQVTFNSGNGTYQLNRLTYSSNLPKNQRLGVVGYSITQGYAAGSIAGTWSRAIGGVVSAGSADYTASILLPGRLQEMHALGERNWIIGGLLGNDIQFGISPAVWQANIINAYDSIISWGSNCYFTLETPRNGVDITAANTFIKATFPNLYIDLFTPLWSGTSYTMNPIYNTGDGTHPNTAGHSAMTKGTQQSFVYNLIQNGAQIPVVTPVTPGAATTVQVSTGAGLAGYPEFFYNHALTQLYSPLIAGGTLTGTGLMIHSNSGFGDGTISFGSTSTGMNYKENNASLAIGTGSVTSGTKLDVRGGGLRVGTTNAAMIFPDYAGSGPATAGSVLIACGACGSGQGLVLDANSNAGTSGAFVKAVAYNGTTLRTVWEYSNTTAGAVPTLKIMDSSGFVRFGATSADTLSSAARGSYTTNLGSTFTPYSWIDYNSADSLAKKRAHDSALAYATVSPKKFAMTADASVNNTSTPTSLIGTGVGSMTIPANSLIAGSTITFKGSGTITTAATPPTMSFSMSVGTSFSATAPTIGASLNGNYEFQYDCIVRTTGAGGTCEFTGWVSVAGTKSYIATGVFALDTTTGNLVDLVLTMGGTVGSGDVVTTKTSSLFVQ